MNEAIQNTIQTIQNTVNTGTHITKTPIQLPKSPTHYKTVTTTTQWQLSAIVMIETCSSKSTVIYFGTLT